jgi:hypothetical protein
MAFVCESLSNTEISGQQTCNKWIVLEQSNGFLPELTATQRDDMALWFFGIFVAVFTVRMIRRLFGI